LHDNSPRTTGDGFALSARAGVVLRDMEFVQFYPLGLVEGGIFRCIVPPWLGDCGPIRNALGENVLVKYGIKERPAAVMARDSLSQAMFREILAGRGFGPCLEIETVMRCKNSKDVMRAFELLNQITTARLVIRGALIRAESRGSQYREDFPETDDSRWQISIRTDGYQDQI